LGIVLLSLLQFLEHGLRLQAVAEVSVVLFGFPMTSEHALPEHEPEPSPKLAYNGELLQLVFLLHGLLQGPEALPVLSKLVALFWPNT
jgi:hypothetical protein